MFESPLLIVALGALGVLLFGERLPEVARSFGKGLMEFQRGVRNIRADIESAIDSAGSPTAQASRPAEVADEDRETATAPKFEPPAS